MGENENESGTGGFEGQRLALFVFRGYRRPNHL